MSFGATVNEGTLPLSTSATQVLHKTQNIMSDIQREIIEALQMNTEDLPETPTLDPADSPLNYPVRENLHREEFERIPTPDDAPEQEIGNGSGSQNMGVPSQETLAFADFILDSANNIIEVGAGFFVKIRKDEDFYSYEELIQVINDQNKRNVKRLLLDDMDKAMLRPLLALVLRNRAKILSPEQQLLIALVSILIKKAQVVMEVRAENLILVDRIKEIIQQENQGQEPETIRSESGHPQNREEETPTEKSTQVDSFSNKSNQSTLPNQDQSSEEYQEYGTPVEESPVRGFENEDRSQVDPYSKAEIPTSQFERSRPNNSPDQHSKAPATSVPPYSPPTSIGKNHEPYSNLPEDVNPAISPTVPYPNLSDQEE